MLLLPGLAKVDSTNTVYSHLFITLGQFRKHYLYQHWHNIVHSYFMGFFQIPCVILISERKHSQLQLVPSFLTLYVRVYQPRISIKGSYAEDNQSFIAEAV